MNFQISFKFIDALEFHFLICIHGVPSYFVDSFLAAMSSSRSDVVRPYVPFLTGEACSTCTAVCGSGGGGGVWCVCMSLQKV